MARTGSGRSIEDVRKRIGEILIQKGLITEQDLQVARFEQKRTSERLGAIFIRLKLVTESQIARTLSEQLGVPAVDLVEHPPSPQAVPLIPREFALKRGCIAWGVEQNVLTVAMCDPLSLSVLKDLEFGTGYRIRQIIAVRSQIVDAIEKGYAPAETKALACTKDRKSSVYRSGKDVPAVAGEAARAGDVGGKEYFETAGRAEQGHEARLAPIIRLVDRILAEAVAGKASDVHIEPTGSGLRVRHRLDGLLREVMDLPGWVADGLVTRIKVMASMDIAEKRLPQDGRLRLRSKGAEDVDFRVSTLNTLHGEKLVLRILDHSRGVPPLESLGLSPAHLQQLQFFLRHPHGMVLAVGPTGSGKSTTLASALSSIKSVRTNTVTIEDPIEYQIAGINQTQINEKARITFAGSLRAILRQDPDIILLGEIRDEETARIAMQAAQTGHLVLSTLHTEDAPSTVTRLMDMGIEPYVIGSALLGVVAQRLLRRLCPHCRCSYTPPPEILRALGIPEDQPHSAPFFHAKGCEECHHTGYQGRIAIYEILHVSSRISRLVAERAGELAIRDAAEESGMVTLGEDGLAKVKAGVTSAEELIRVVTEVREIRTYCPDCTCPVGFEFVACPHCGRRLGGSCLKCGRTLRSGWNFCPFCASHAGQRPARPQELVMSNVADL